MGELAALPAGPVARAAIAAFVKAYGVDLSEAIVPRGGFRTFDEFFTRELKPGARPVEGDNDTLVSPADGRIEDFGPVDERSTFLVKGKPYTAEELLGGEESRYAGGQFFIVYLSPRDYHRVHAPVGGPVRRLRYVPGTLYPVNRIGLDYVDGLFARNERVVITQSSDFGDVTTVMVGAIGVGRISVVFDDVVT
ncbi:MAG: archaetidylserine decarboxylase, partial [Myxococcota bacterium]